MLCEGRALRAPVRRRGRGHVRAAPASAVSGGPSAATLLRSVAPIGINAVVNADTIGELDDLAGFAVDVGASELLLLPEQPTAATPGISVVDAERLVRWIRTARTRVRLAISRSGLEALVPAVEVIPGERPLDAHMHVDASGVLRPHAYASVGMPSRGLDPGCRASAQGGSMRIWHSYGSEHSMDLVLVGRFETVSGAEAAIERMEALKALAQAEWSDDDWRRQDERMPDTLLDELMKLELYEMGRSDVDIYALDHSVERRGSTIRIWTEESEVQGFLKVLIHLGARVEVFSRHDWNEDGTARTEAGS